MFCTQAHATPLLLMIIYAGSTISIANELIELVFMPEEAARRQNNKIEQMRREMSIQAAYIQRIWGGYINDVDLITGARNELDLATTAMSRACNRYHLDCGMLIPANVYFSSLPESRLGFIGRNRSTGGDVHNLRITTENALTYEISADTLLAEDRVAAMTEELADLLFYYFDDQKPLLTRLKEQASEMMFKNSSALRPTILKLVEQQGMRFQVDELRWPKVAQAFKSWALHELAILRRQQNQPITLNWTSRFSGLNDVRNPSQISKHQRVEIDYVHKFQPRLQEVLLRNDLMTDYGNRENIKQFTLSLRTMNLKDFNNQLPNQYFTVQCEPHTPRDGYITGTMSRLFVNLPRCHTVTLENVMNEGRKSVANGRATLYKDVRSQPWGPKSTAIVIGALIGGVTLQIAMRRVGLSRLVPGMNVAGEGATNSVTGGLLNGSTLSLSAPTRAVNLTRIASASLNAFNIVTIGGIALASGGLQYMVFPWGEYYVQIKMRVDADVSKMREFIWYLQERLDEAYKGELDVEVFKRDVLTEGRKYGIEDINFFDRIEAGARK
jgi:hypothetical protein